MTAFSDRPLPSPQRAERIKTPCIGVCQLERERPICAGCGRTVNEIMGWMRLSSEQRDKIMAELPARLRNR